MWHDVGYQTIVRRAIFLDRDGVLNEPIVRDGKPFPPANAAELIVSPGAKGALDALRAEGFALICVTNQPDVARGTMPLATIEAIHARLRTELPLDEIIVCPHDDVDACSCRKPKPGLIYEGARRLGIDISRSYLVGDRWRDIEAGAAAQCRTVFIDRGYTERAPLVNPDARVNTIGEAAACILAHVRRELKNLPPRA